MFHTPLPIENLYLSLVFSCSMCLGLLSQLLVLSCTSLLPLPLCHILIIFHSQPQYVAYIVLIYLNEQSYSSPLFLIPMASETLLSINHHNCPMERMPGGRFLPHLYSTFMTRPSICCSINTSFLRLTAIFPTVIS